MVVYLSMCAILAIMVGVLCLFAGVIRLGFLADPLSKPILAIWPAGRDHDRQPAGQFTGAPVEGDEVIAQVKVALVGARSDPQTRR